MKHEAENRDSLLKELEKLRQELDFYKTIADKSSNWEVCRDTSGKIIFINEAFETITGYPRHDILSGAITERDVVYPDDWPRVSMALQKSAARQQVFNLEFRIVRKDGDIRDISLSAIPVYKNGTFAGTRTSAKDITEELRQQLKDVHQELESSEKRFKTYIDSSPTAVFIADELGRYTYANPAVCELLGYSIKEILNLSIAQIAPPDLQAENIESFRRMAQVGRIVGQESQLLHKDGHRVHIILDAVKISDNEFVAFVKDVTQLRKAEIRLNQQLDEYGALNKEYRTTNEELMLAKQKAEQNASRVAEQARLLDKIFDHAADSIVLLDKDYNFVKVSRSYAEACGRNIEEFAGKNHFELYPSPLKEEFDYHRKHKTIYKKKARPFTFPKQPERGTTYWDLGLVPILDNQEEISLFIFTLSDVTREQNYRQQLIHAKEKAEENELKYRLMYENTSIGIAVISLDFKMMAANRAYCNMLGYTEPELVDKTLKDITAPEMLSQNLSLQKDLSQGKISAYQLEKQFIHKKGHPVYGLLNATIIKNTKGEPLYFLGNVQDITDRKHGEQELLKAKERAEESDRLKTAFLQNMSHEIRTPLNAICGFSNMLERKGLNADKQKSFVSIINSSSTQLLSIVNDILTISALETNQEQLNVEAVSVNSLILELLAMFKQHAGDKHIALYSKQTLDNPAAQVFTDRTKLTQILSNLISNAIKFTQRGYVEFGYNLRYKDELVVMEFYVKDTGMGVSPHLHQKIFERFRQADLSISKDYGGTGLGLSISKGFVELLGGSIRLDSDLNQGATFYFTIPYRPVHEVEQLPQNLHKPGNGQTVLVAEDEIYNYLYIEELLLSRELKLLHTRNGEEAINAFKNNPDIVLILMDIKMPIMDGHTAAQKIRAINAHVPIVAQSAYALAQEIELYGAVFDDYLPKPIAAESLYQIVDKYLSPKSKK